MSVDIFFTDNVHSSLDLRAWSLENGLITQSSKLQAKKGNLKTNAYPR